MNWNRLFYYLLLSLLVVNSFEMKSQSPFQENEKELIFQSGFEPTSTVIPRSGGAEADIIGKQVNLEKSDWVQDLDNNPLMGYFNLQYQGGDDSMRFAKIIPEPGNAQNHVLQFWLNYPNVGGTKGRIQANLYGATTGLKEFYQSVRVFLTSDFEQLRTYPNYIDWFTIAEYWNNITWSQSVPYGFRITLGIGKPVRTTGDLYFFADAQDCELHPDDSQTYTTIWHERNTNVKVPINEWFTLNTYYKDGNAETGRYFLEMINSRGERFTILDVNNFTHHTANPSSDGVTEFNPIKLYTSKAVIDYVRNNGKALNMYWDDFKLYKDKLVSTVTVQEFSEDLEFYSVSENNYYLGFNKRVESANVSIFNVAGQLLYSQDMKDESFLHLDLNSYLKGVYIVFVTKDKHRNYKKLVVD